MHLRVRVHNTEVKNPLLKVLIAIPAVLIALGITALVLLFVLPAIGIILTSTLLIVALVVGAVFVSLPILLVLKRFTK